MSTTVDSRVVEMRFDNKQFETNVQTSISTLEKLKKSLNLSKASENLKGIDEAAKKVDMSGLSKSVDTVRARFSALQVIGTTALVNITNTAVNAGKRMLKALTIDPIKTGFQEYELKMNSIQTIMSNTANKGTTMKDVINVLDELNTYADKTIYNFAEMTRNIGTFTAAGVGLEDAASAIQGIANLAAASGSSSQQASTAMYQLSQALAAGTVKLMDWNSVVNAGMGGQKFQEALKATAREQGIAIDAIIEKHGSFRESLQEGWITADVLNDTLKKFTVEGAKEYSKSMMESGKWTQKQADALIKEAQAMNDAATKVKTFTQLWDTLKEAAQSGWAQTWEIIVGNFDEAKAMLSDVSDAIGGIIGRQADMRNKILQGWKDLGGRTEIIDSIRNVFEGLVSVVKPIHQAFKEVIPPITAKKLYDFSVGLKKLTEGFKLSDENADKLKRTFKGLFSIVDFFRKILTSVAKVIGSLFTSGSVNGVLDLILTITASIGDFFTAINSGFNLNGLTSIFSGIAQVIGGVVSGLSGAGDALTGIGRSVAEVVNSIWTTIKEFFSWVTGNISFSDIFAGLAGGGIFLAAKKLKGLFEDLSEMTSGGLLGLILGKAIPKPKFLEQFSNILGSVNESLQAFTGGIKVASLVAIASAIAILSNALKTISELNAVDVGKSLMAMGLMFGMLTTSFKSLTKALNIFPSKGIVKAGISMMLIAKAIDILAGAMKEIGSLSLEGVAKGLAGIGGSMLILVGGLKAIQGSKVSISAIITVTGLANAMKTMSKSLVELGSLKWGEVGRGLTAMGGALTELLVTMKILSKVSGAKSLTGSISLLIMTKSLGDIADALTKLGKMSWGEVARGLSAMGGALVELGAVMVTVGKLGGLSGIVGAAVIVEGARSLEDIANALVKVGKLSWGGIARGLTGIGGALTELATISALLGKIGGLSGLVGAVALVEGAKALGDIAKAFTVFAGMKWKEIKMGLAGMGGALAEVAVITGALGKLAGFSGLLGAGAILLAVQSLGDITDAFKVFEGMEWGNIGKGIVGLGAALSLIAGISGALGKIAGFSGLLGAGTILIACKSLGDIANALKEIGALSWAEIARGLTGMGGALLEVAVISGGLGKLAELSGLLGSGAIALACTGLEEIGNSLKKLGSMSWSEIGRGLAAMGAALGESAIGSVLNTFSMLGALSISAVAEPLGKLADSLKKWCGLKLPENLGGQLGKLAVGVTKFTFGGFGASAITTVAEPLGTLAGSVKKWSNVTVPENIAGQLTNLAKGVKAFTWAFLGGMSMDTAVEPLGKIATAVKKWNGVTVPEGLGDQLKSLSPGIKAFTFGGNGASALSEVAGPLGTLATSVKKWSDVTVPENLGSELETLSDAVKKFSNSGDMTSGAEGIKSVANSIKKLSGVKFDTIITGIKDFMKAIGNLGSSSEKVTSIGQTLTNSLVKPINNLGPKLKTAGSKLANNLVSGLQSNSSLNSAASKLTSNMAKVIKSKGSTFKAAGSKLGTYFAVGLKAKRSDAANSVKALVDAASRAATSKSSSFKSAGNKMADGFASGIKSNKKPVTAASSMATSAASAVRGKYSSFYGAGQSLANGFANGISANSFLAAAQARAMANAAEQAARDALDINSPSKVFDKIGRRVPEGFANGIGRFGGLVRNSIGSMTSTAMDETKTALARLGRYINSDMDVNPTIRPVMDLSGVESGVGAISGMLGKTMSIGVNPNMNAVSSTMSSRIQNDAANDVVSAINGLRKELGNVSGNTYNLSGITYDDGSNVADAIQTLVRAAVVERRK